MSEPVNGEAPLLRVVVEMKGPNVSVQGNAPWPVLLNLLKEGIVAGAQQMLKDRDKSLVMPVTGAVPPGPVPPLGPTTPLRRLP